VKRLVRASTGWIELDAMHMGRLGLSVRVTTFPEEGWASFEQSWNSRWPGEGAQLESFLVTEAGLPTAEAEEIARETLQEWRDLGAEATDIADANQAIALTVATLVLAAIGVLALLGALAVGVVWLLL
jgi:hypothetical protein